MKKVICDDVEERIAMHDGDEIMIKIVAKSENNQVAFGLFINGERVEKCIDDFKLDLKPDRFILKYQTASIIRDGNVEGKNVFSVGDTVLEREEITMDILPFCILPKES